MALTNFFDYFRRGVSDAHRGQVIRPVQMVSQWVPATTEAGAKTTDVGNDPWDFDESRIVLQVGDRGTNLRVRLNYQTGITVNTDPIVRVYGRTRMAPTKTELPTNAVDWQILHNRNQTFDVALVTESSDVLVNSRRVTRADQKVHMWDLDGCDEIVISVRTAIATAATMDVAFIEAKVI